MEKISHEQIHEPIAAFMRRDYTSLRVGQTIAEALDSLRQQPVGEKIIYFYVLEDDGKLVGVVPTRRLLMSRPDEKLDDVMIRNVVTIPDTMSVLEACEFFVMYRLLAFPVVDPENRLLGVVDVNLFTDQMMDLSERGPSMPDIFQIIGIHIAQGRRGSPWAGFRDRFPWLLCNLGGGIACAFIAGLHERFLNTVIVLALFIPLVLTLAEGVSMQSMTLTLQSFLGEGINWKMVFRSLRSELLTAALLGLASGALVAIVSWVWKRELAVSIAIGLSISLGLVTACLLGVIVPSVVRWMKRDPKFASGPVVLASADVTTMIVYFFLAGAILG
ncbi:MAG TPA: magnesium transporter [Tepidisphaeraceae bacterium]|nr:magnesium transporter [Tepidisphaeraceae bacterium]